MAILCRRHVDLFDRLSYKSSNTEFHVNSSLGSRTDTDVRTDSHDEANRHFVRQCESAHTTGQHPPPPPPMSTYICVHISTATNGKVTHKLRSDICGLHSAM